VTHRKRIRGLENDFKWSANLTLRLTPTAVEVLPACIVFIIDGKKLIVDGFGKIDG
jgi:hypothetical protein